MCNEIYLSDPGPGAIAAVIVAVFDTSQVAPINPVACKHRSSTYKLLRLWVLCMKCCTSSRWGGFTCVFDGRPVVGLHVCDQNMLLSHLPAEQAGEFVRSEKGGSQQLVPLANCDV